ncbi:MFS transporter [Paradesulfitobacterium ferrireducens]|uniref:MFS transporter n=1 Tax=Paradesulfitobacterium ferrireducens TaxID=2816476 RepID=UPI001A8EC18E|nr:MFS transporter [Paradesulfitobacterium ferrireducens]
MLLNVMNKLNAFAMKSFPALTHPPFRWFWGGQIISLIGTWTQNVGQAWLVLQITDSPFLLGLVSALQFLPMLLFSLHAGVWIDRLPKRRILILTQSVMMILAFLLASLVGSGLIQFWMLALIAFVLGIANTVDVPARQSFVIELVGKKHLTNAIALNSAIFNGARLAGPAIAGIIMALWGATWCFIINGISFIGVILILVFLLPAKQVETNPSDRSNTPVQQQPMWPEIKEGLLYIKRTPPIFLSILMIGVLSPLAMNFNVLVPVLAKMDLHRDVLGYGLLMSAMGFGAMLGALTVALLSKFGPRVPILLGGAGGLGIFSILLGFQVNYGTAALILAFMGWCMIVFAASANSLIQMTVDNRLRGRVMSVYSLVFGGMTPVGSFFSGSLAHLWGARKTFAFSGFLVLVFLGFILPFQRKLQARPRREG